MTVSTVSALPAAPQRTDDGTTFASRADAFVAALSTFRTELNTSIGEFNTDAGTVNTNATTATTQAAAASASAAAAAISATLSGYVGTYAGGTTYSIGQVVGYAGTFWVSLQNSNTGNTPAAGSSYWAVAFNITIPTINLNTSPLGSDIDLAEGIDFVRTVAGNTTFTMSNVPGSGVTTFVLEITYTSGTITFWSGYTVNWSEALGDAQPTFTAGHRYKIAAEIRGGTTVIDILSVLDYD